MILDQEPYLAQPCDIWRSEEARRNWIGRETLFQGHLRHKSVMQEKHPSVHFQALKTTSLQNVRYGAQRTIDGRFVRESLVTIARDTRPSRNWTTKPTNNLRLTENTLKRELIL